MYYFIKKQFDIDHSYISSYFEYDEEYADDFDEYFWLEERWFSHSGNDGNMRLVQRGEIPASFYEAHEINDIDDIECERGCLCAINVAECLKENRHNEVAYDIIMAPSFPLREEFDRLRELYYELKKKYDETDNAPKRRLGLRRN